MSVVTGRQAVNKNVLTHLVMSAVTATLATRLIPTDKHACRVGEFIVLFDCCFKMDTMISKLSYPFVLLLLQLSRKKNVQEYVPGHV